MNSSDTDKLKVRNKIFQLKNTHLPFYRKKLKLNEQNPTKVGYSLIHLSIYFIYYLDTNTSKTLPLILSKSSLSTKTHLSSTQHQSKDRLDQILKIANSIKSRSGLLPWIYSFSITISGGNEHPLFFYFAQDFYVIIIAYLDVLIVSFCCCIFLLSYIQAIKYLYVRLVFFLCV